MKKIKISYLLLSLVIISNLFLIYKNMELSNYINSNTSYLSEINNNMHSLEYKVDSLPAEILKESSFVSSVDMNLLSSAFTDDAYVLSFNVYFKELQNGETPYIIYTEKESPSNWTKIALNENSTLCYSADLQLNYSNNYQYRIITEGNTSRANEIEEIASTDYYPLKVDAYDLWDNYNSDSTNIGIDIYNNYELSDFEPVSIYVTIDGYDKKFSAELNMDTTSENSNMSQYIASISPQNIPSDFRGPIPINVYVTCKNGSTLTFENIIHTVIIN